MIKFEISKTLVLSTAHAAPDTREFLDGGRSSFTVWSSDYGWFIPVESALSSYELTGTPEDLEDLSNCLKLAKQHECEFLRLDGDGPIVDGLQTFNDSQELKA